MLKNQQMSFEIEKVQKDAEIHHLRNIELKEAYSILEKRTKEILDSIDYAKNIQNAILPPLDYFYSLFPESFVYYKPKDIVSGDFYWCFENGNRIYVAAADCTGHGVPGGFMSVLGISLLNEIINSCATYNSDTLLNELRKRIITSLRQSSSFDSIKDGMDIALCCIDKDKQVIEFSGAYNPMYVVADSQLSEIKSNRMPIGILGESQAPFEKNIVPIKKGMSIYLFSDGFMDQFGGTEGKKMKAKSFRDLILSISSQPIKNQSIALNHALSEWSQGYEQVDDILVIGIQF
jgi:serine phosphatase RsbU (regulator of sigma subunit)